MKRAFGLAVILLVAAGCQEQERLSPLVATKGDGDLYVAILSNQGRPGSAIMTQQQAWKTLEVDASQMLSKYKVAPPYPEAGMLDEDDIAALEAKRFDVVTTEEAQYQQENLKKGLDKDDIWSFTEPLRLSDGKAVVYAEMYCGPLCGGGTFYVLEKQNGTWEIIAKITMWVS
jgi:hypothetical protein